MVIDITGKKMNIIKIDPYEESDKNYYIGGAYFPKLNLYVLSGVFHVYPQFLEDFETLWQNGIITSDKNRLRWNYKLVSLAQYFRDLESRYGNSPDWWTVEIEFGIRRHTLKHLASRNGNRFYCEKSVDYEKIIELLKLHRKNKKNDRKKYFEGDYSKIKKFFEMRYMHNMQL